MRAKAKKVFSLWFLFVLCLAPTLVLTYNIASMHVQYEEVYATVVDVQSVYKGPAFMAKKALEVTVRYDGGIYRLQKPDPACEYKVGSKVRSYLSNGILYADAKDVLHPFFTSFRPGTAIYLAFLLASAALLIAAVLSTVKRGPKPKAKRVKAPPRPSYDPERRK